MNTMIEIIALQTTGSNFMLVEDESSWIWMLQATGYPADILLDTEIFLVANSRGSLYMLFY